MEEKQLSPQESIKIIEDMMILSRSTAKDKAWFFWLFGILTVLCSIGHYIFLRMNIPQGSMIWILMGIGGIFAGFRSRQIAIAEPHKSQSDSLYGFVWLSFGLTYVFGFIACFYNYEHFYQFINPLVMSLAGGATMLSGKLIKFRPFIIGGLVMWLTSLLALFTSIENQLLLNIVAVSGGYLFPAWLLNKSNL